MPAKTQHPCRISLGLKIIKNAENSVLKRKKEDFVIGFESVLIGV